MATKKYISFSNLSSFLDSLKDLFATKTEMSAKSDKTHSHVVSDVNGLQSALDGKAASSHGTHVSFSSTTPVMDGTASAGSASTVARSDHRHPIDTSRAAQTSLDSHTGNTTAHITSAERTNWGAGYTHSQSAHAPSNAEKNQNAFSNVTVGSTTIAADSTTDTLTLVAGTNVTITPDATNDKITISAKDTTYSLSSFGITATASELNKLDGVTATATEINYVDGVTSNIQTQLDGKAATSHTHTVANITDLTATAKELNYMDGVTSNVQTQLDTLDSALDTKAKRISLNGQCQVTSYRTSVIALCKAPINASCGEAINSYSAGQLTLHRNNGLYAPVIATLSMGASHGAVNRVRFRGLCSSGFSIFNPCTFTYNGVTYGGLEFKTSDAEAHSVTFVGETTFDIFALDIYDSNQKVILNEEVYNSISYDNAIVETGWKDTDNAFITSANIGSQSVASATKDGNGKVISSTYETKTDASNKLSAAKAYADSAAAAVKNDLLNGAGTAYDTLKELGDLIDNNTSAIDALEAVAAGKANKTHTHAISDVTNLQTALDAKQATVTGGASTIASSNLTANRALISNGSGKVAVSAVTSTELGYLDGVTSNLQTQLDAKASSSHTHSYAGSSSVGGAATSANKLNTDAGSATQPVYFSDGIPVATTYTLGKSVPSDAKFTDTTYSAATTSANGLMSSTDKKRVDSMSGSYSLGSFASKTVADLQAALDTWLNSYVNIANASAKFQASQDWVTAWNSGNTSTTISAGGTWTVTNIAPYSTKAYAQLRISYYSDEWVVYVHRSSGTWGTAHQVAFKDDLTLKQDTITGGASTITSSNLTASRALVSNSSGKVAVSAVTSTELGYLDGVTSNVQTQLDGKAASSHNHSASNITSGTLSSDRLPTVPISKGGTGATSAAAALTNLGITATATELNYVDGVTSSIQTQLNNKAASSHTHNTTYIPDTRDDNQTPAWYITNYPRQVVTEFKLTSTIGLSGPTYCELTTYVQWSNNSGGYPSQETIINGRLYTRYGTSDTAWSDWKTNIDSDNISSQSVATATQLKTARTISLGTGATGTATSFNGTANITIPVTDVKESYLSWGGKNLSGSVSPISASLSAEHSANRIAYLNPDAIMIEYSNDAGSTWTDSGLANSAKINLVTTSNGISVGSNSTVTTNHRTRITLTGQDGTNGYVYTRPRKMLINVSTAGHGLTVTIEAKTGASGASWTTLGTYPLSGWSGWNDIPMGISTFGGGANQTGNYWYIRLTFATTSVSSSYTTTKSTVLGLRLFGDTCWTRTSNMGETGHLYSYDYSQNATFPANVTATTLSGTTFSGSGVATLAEVKSYLGI